MQLLNLCIASTILSVVNAFGIALSNGNYIVTLDSTPQFVITFDSYGSIESMLYNGDEYQHVDNGRQSGVSDNIGTNATCTRTVNTNTALLACTGYGGLIRQYWMFQRGLANIYSMTYDQPGLYGTSFGTANSITYRFDPNMFDTAVVNTSASSIYPGNQYGTIDQNIFNRTDTGLTASPHYSKQRAIDPLGYSYYISSSSTGVGAYFQAPPTAYEKGTGGPFLREYRYLFGRDTTAINSFNDEVSLYFYYKSQRLQTENYRYGLNGPNVMQLTQTAGTAPALPDFSFISTFNLPGYVAQSGRGQVSGTLTNMRSGQHVVHFYNNNYQYWAIVQANGNYVTPYMVPGTYNMNTYRVELRIAAAVITVQAGQTTSIAVNGFIPGRGARTVYWIIGSFDGQPNEFENGGEQGQLHMHPSDPRQIPYGPITYNIGDPAGTFPITQLYGINGPTTILFPLAANQVQGPPATLRIATCVQVRGARPNVTFNGVQLPVPPAPVSAVTGGDRRAFTAGAYRGYGESYDFSIPSNILLPGVTNTIHIDVAATNLVSDPTDVYRNAGWMYDALEFFRDP